jgi:hypothetical protein
MYPDEFVKAADALGMPLHTKTMDAKQVFAMMQEANIDMKTTLGKSQFANEEKVRALSDRFLIPSIQTFRHQNKERDFWYHDQDKIIALYIATFRHR